MWFPTSQIGRMNLSNVKLIYLREMRDQLRDRRTLFLIAVLPLLLYPLLGMSFFQLSQFLRHHAAKVVIVGAEELDNLDWLPPLVVEDQFATDLFIRNPEEIGTLQLVKMGGANNSESLQESSDPMQLASDALGQGEVQVVLVFPSGFRERLLAVRQALLERENQVEPTVQAELLEPQLFYNSANEKSRIAQLRTERVVRNWRLAVMQANLREGNVPLVATAPFELQPQDVAKDRQRHAAVWSKILPFILFIWALTGAFYPAVDLCAGEKERGTLETLLASPAQRGEIVWGKLLTVMTFSMVTALLNLGSMGLTGKFVLAQFQEISTFSGTVLSLPPSVSVVWLMIALVPIAALFSALCLACAAFARSTKEGQYYLMPLLLIVMPLMMLPLSPGVELNLGNSLIPVTGVVLLLRSMIEGQYWQALPYVLPVVLVTFLCCLLAIRWAEEQFNSESVLFRESERLDLGRWLVHLVRDRSETPTFAQAILCVTVIMVIQFFVKLALSVEAAEGIEDFKSLVQMTFISQVVCIALPVALLTLLFTRNRRQTLLLKRFPTWQMIVATVLLALFVRPLGMELATAIQQLYPPSPDMAQQLDRLEQAIKTIPNWWSLILLLAVLPALCEELAFRGFILSGLRHVGHKWWAIGLSAVAFGMVHPILQQQIAAAAVGLVLSYLAIQTESLLLCMLLHAIYNGLGLAMAQLLEPDAQSTWGWLLSSYDILIFHPAILIASAVGTMTILRWLHHLPYHRTAEEQLQEARERNLASA